MKVIRTAAIVIGAVALIATGVGAVIGGAAFLATFGVSLTLVSAIGTLAGIAAQLTAPKPKNTAGGSQTDFKLDPKAHVPIMFGRTFNGGNIVARDTWGTDNEYQGFVVVYSGCGPVSDHEAYYIDRNVVPLGLGGAAGGQYAGFMWAEFQLGACPEAGPVPMPIAGFPGWGAASKLSGMYAGGLVFKFDKKGKKWAGGVPRNGVVGTGVRVYDPRLDDTYPGGVGPCRAGNEATYVETLYAPLMALTYALGWRQGPNNRPVGGIQASIDNIDVASFVQAANVAEANGWQAGAVYTTGDGKWGVMRALLQSCNAEPVWLGARLSCRMGRPRVSVATIGTNDLRGSVRVVGSASQRAGRVNGVIAVYRSEDHGWEQVPADVVRVAAYVPEDGGERTREIEFPTVQDVGQAGQLAAYEIVNGRELGPVSVPVGLEFGGVEPGMCIDLDIPESSLAGQFEVLSRRFNHTDAVFTLECRSETDGKHPFALGTTATPPPTPSLAAPDYDAVAANFETEAEAITKIRTSAARGVELLASVGTIDVTSDFDAAPWSPANVDVDVDVEAGPLDGAMADTLTVTATPDAQVSRASAGARRLRVDFKPGTAGFFYAFMDTGAGFKATWVNTATGALATNELAGTIEAKGGGWLRLVITGVCTGDVGFGLSNADASTAATVGETAHVYEASLADTAGVPTVEVSAHFRDYPDRSLLIDAAVATGMAAGTGIWLYYDDPGRSDATPVVQWTGDYEEAVNDSVAAPYRHYLGSVQVPAVGVEPVPGTSPPYPGGGGYCVAVDTLIDVEGGTVRADALRPGDMVLTRHERTFELGLFPVTSAEIVSINCAYEALGLVGSSDHRIWLDGEGWQRLAAIGEPVGPRRVVRITVADARTYVSNGLLSHNIKADLPPWYIPPSDEW